MLRCQTPLIAMTWLTNSPSRQWMVWGTISPLILMSLHYIMSTSAERQGTTLHCSKPSFASAWAFHNTPLNTPTMTQCHASIEWELEGWRHINPSCLEDFKWMPHNKVALAQLSSVVFLGVIAKQRWSIPPLRSSAFAAPSLNFVVIKHWHHGQLCVGVKSSYLLWWRQGASSHQL